MIGTNTFSASNKLMMEICQFYFERQFIKFDSIVDAVWQDGDEFHISFRQAEKPKTTKKEAS